MSISFGLYRTNIRCDLQFRPSAKSSPVTPRFWAIFGMSALGHDVTSASCLLFPSKRTFISAVCTSA